MFSGTLFWSCSLLVVWWKSSIYRLNFELSPKVWTCYDHQWLSLKLSGKSDELRLGSAVLCDWKCSRLCSKAMCNMLEGCRISTFLQGLCQHPKMVSWVLWVHTRAPGSPTIFFRHSKMRQSMPQQHLHELFLQCTGTLTIGLPCWLAWYWKTHIHCFYLCIFASQLLTRHRKFCRVGRVQGFYWPWCNGRFLLWLIFCGDWRYRWCWRGRCASPLQPLWDGCRKSPKLQDTSRQHHQWIRIPRSFSFFDVWRFLMSELFECPECLSFSAGRDQKDRFFDFYWVECHHWRC